MRNARRALAAALALSLAASGTADAAGRVLAAEAGASAGRALPAPALPAAPSAFAGALGLPSLALPAGAPGQDAPAPSPSAAPAPSLERAASALERPQSRASGAALGRAEAPAAAPEARAEGPVALRALAAELPDFASLPASGAKESAAADFARRLGLPEGPSAEAAGDDAALEPAPPSGAGLAPALARAAAPRRAVPPRLGRPAAAAALGLAAAAGLALSPFSAAAAAAGLAFVVLPSLVLHEMGHAWAARRLGDSGPARAGRLGLGLAALKSHLDPVWTVLAPLASGLLLGVYAGRARPVEVDPARLASPIRDLALISAAGPAVNLVLAAGAALAHALLAASGAAGLLPGLLLLAAAHNAGLAAFNLLPAGGLDGAAMARGLERALAPRAGRAARPAALALQLLLAAAPAALLAALVGAPVLALLVLVAAAACVHYKTLAATEAGRQAFQDDASRLAAMKDLQNVLRGFGARLEKENDNPEVKTHINAELVTRSAVKGVATAFDRFIKSLAETPEADLAGARRLFDEAIRAGLLSELRTTGLSGDADAAIEAMIAKSGVLAEISSWEDRHDFVETLLRKMREAREKLPRGEEAAEETGLAKAAAKAGKIGGLLLLLAAGGAASLLGHGFAAVAAAVKKAPEAAPPEAPKNAPKKEPTALERHLEASGLTPEDIEFLDGVSVDMAEVPQAPLEGRLEELRKLVGVLSRPRGVSRSALVTGPAGVGRRALAQAVAHGLAAGRYESLKGLRMIELDTSRLVGANVERFALQLRSILEKAPGRLAIFIDRPELLRHPSTQEHTFFQILRPALERGDAAFIVSATPRERKQLDEKGPFPLEPIVLEAPSQEQAEAMLETHAPSLREAYGLTAEPGLFKAAARLAARYVPTTSLPGSALAVLRTTFAGLAPEARANQRQAETHQLIRRLTRALRAGMQDNARHNRAAADLERLLDLRAQAEPGALDPRAGRPVSEEDVARVVSEMSGIPVSKVLQAESEKLLRLEENLRRRVIHQDPAVAALAAAVRRARAGLKDPKKPIGSFLFLGPTGVGKTELARGLAEHLFDDEEALIRFDMSEYMERHSVARLIGTHPGYVGYDEGGQLTGAVRRRPYSVVLLDEIEKAHPDVLNLFLQAMDAGRLTDGHGNTVDFSNVIFIMTSNVGSQHLQKLLEEGADHAVVHADALTAARAHFKPEFLNRLDDIVAFDPLDKAKSRDVVTLHLENKVKRWMASAGLVLRWPAPEPVLDLLVESGFDPLLGGRPLARAVQRLVLDPLAVKLIASAPMEGDPAERPELSVALEAEGGTIGSAVTPLPPKAVARREPADAEARALLEGLAVRGAELTPEAVEDAVFGRPEAYLPKAPLGIYHPLEKPRGGKVVSEVRASDDDPDLKDAAQDGAAKAWPSDNAFPKAAAEAFRKWFDKTVRCAKSTNHKRPMPHEKVGMRWLRKDGVHEFQITGLPLTREEVKEVSRIYQNHFATDSESEDQSWELADALLDKGEYGRAQLFEVKRALRAVPGATFGYSSDAEGLVFWLRVPEAAPAVLAASQAAPAPAKAPAKVPTVSDAAAAYRRAAPADEDSRPLTEAIAGLLSSEDSTAVFWGFKLARATLTDEGFDRLVPFLPPAGYVAQKVAALYREDATLRAYYPEPAAPRASERDQLLERALKGDTRLVAARDFVAAGAPLDASAGQAAVNRLLRSYRQLNFFTKLRRWSQWATPALWTVGAGLAIASLVLKRTILLEAWGCPIWLQVAVWLLLAAAAITASILGFADWTDDRQAHKAQEAGHDLEISIALFDALPDGEKERVVRHWLSYVGAAWHARMNLDHDSDRAAFASWHEAAAGALNARRDLLTPEQRRRLASAALARSETPHKNEAVAAADASIPLILSDLLDADQQRRALDLVLDRRVPPKPEVISQLSLLAAQKRLNPAEQDAVLKYLLEALRTSRGWESSAHVLSGMRTAAGLAADKPDNLKLHVAEELAKVQSSHWQGPYDDRSREYAQAKPMEFYRIVFGLATPGKALAGLLGEGQRDSKLNLGALTWLLRNERLDEAQTARARERVLAAAKDKNWEAIEYAVSEMKDLPWKERLDLVVAAAGAGDLRELSRSGDRFAQALAALYAERRGRP